MLHVDIKIPKGALKPLLNIRITLSSNKIQLLQKHQIVNYCPKNLKNKFRKISNKVRNTTTTNLNRLVLHKNIKKQPSSVGSPLFDYSNLFSLSDSWVLIILLQETTCVSHKINWTVMKNEWWSFEEMQSQFEWDSSLEKYWDLSAIIIGRNELIGRKFCFTSWLVMQMRLPLPLTYASSPASVLCPVIDVI